MNASAVIIRELRAESRRGANYWLRVLAAGVLILTFASIMLTQDLGASEWGQALFGGLNMTLFWALWVLVPLMTADCVSREKREGTLGLLFLTPLTVMDVIAGKVAIHVLRALTLFLAAMPMVGLPLVFGGVDWRWFVVAAVGQANAVLLGIAAGISASTRGGSTIQVMVRAEAYALALAALSSFASRLLAEAIPGPQPMFGWLVAFVGLSAAGSLVLFVLILLVSVRRLARTWQEEPATAEQPRWVKLVSGSDFWQAFFHWDKSRTLDRNPVAWLQEYSWTARLTKWGWFAVMLLAHFALLTQWEDYRSASWQPVLTITLGLGVAFSAVGSFRREQETGLLELLLVAPFSERHLLRGRFWGICCHYFPALAVLWLGWVGDRLLNPRIHGNDLITALFPNPLAFVATMVVGLYLSLGRLNFFLAWFLAWIVGFVLPILAGIGLGRLLPAGPMVALGLPVVLQAGLAAVMWFLLHRKVRQREFAIGKSDRNLLV